MTTTKQKIIFIIMLFAAGLAGRFLPHLWNATPIVAIALFAGTYLGVRHAVFLTLAIMLVSDFFLGFYNIEVMFAVYGSFVLVGLISYFLKHHKNWTNIFLASMVSSSLFFLVTNWAVWQFSPWYEKSFEGLMLSYTLAIPFFRNMFFGDLVYTLMLFGVYEVVVVGIPALKFNKNLINN